MLNPEVPAHGVWPCLQKIHTCFAVGGTQVSAPPCAGRLHRKQFGGRGIRVECVSPAATLPEKLPGAEQPQRQHERECRGEQQRLAYEPIRKAKQVSFHEEGAELQRASELAVRAIEFLDERALIDTSAPG